jgi:hypothetical protein
MDEAEEDDTGEEGRVLCVFRCGNDAYVVHSGLQMRDEHSIHRRHCCHDRGELLLTLHK